MPRARRRCGSPGCDRPVPCPVHGKRPWEGTNRTFPANWATVVREVLSRDPRCRIAYPGTWWTRRGETRCAVQSTEVDHIGSNANHSPENLRGVCGPCHTRRTQEQANAGR